MINKKGLSSLITVVILIGFVVVTGIGFYLFINRYTAERIEEVGQDEECLDVNIKILNSCYNENDIKIKVESKTSRRIDKGFLIKVLGDKTTLIPSLPLTTLDGLNIEDITVAYVKEEMGDLKGIEVIPKIKKVNGEQVICSLQSDKEDIGIC